MTATVAGRLLLLVLLGRWTWLFLLWPMRQDVIGSSFLHTISIPFHEAGHILFAPFGSVIAALGGSVAQVLVPIVCLLAFLTTHPNPFGATVMAWWTGQNLMDVSVYIDDARALQLVLLGGRTGAEVEGHDWEFVLTSWNLLHRDHQIAAVVQGIGALTMLVAFIWGCVLVRDRQPDRAP